jgi:hypothetical protein
LHGRQGQHRRHRLECEGGGRGRRSGTVKGSAGTEKDGSFACRADIQIGTLGKIITVF